MKLPCTRLLLLLLVPLLLLPFAETCFCLCDVHWFSCQAIVCCREIASNIQWLVKLRSLQKEIFVYKLIFSPRVRVFFFSGVDFAFDGISLWTKMSFGPFRLSLWCQGYRRRIPNIVSHPNVQKHTKFNAFKFVFAFHSIVNICTFYSWIQKHDIWLNLKIFLTLLDNCFECMWMCNVNRFVHIFRQPFLTHHLFIFESQFSQIKNFNLNPFKRNKTNPYL